MNNDIKRVIKKNKYRSKFYSEVKGNTKDDKVDKNESRNWLLSFTNKLLISAIIFLVLLISKNDENLKFIYKATFSHLNFAQIDTFFLSQYNSLFPKTTNDYQYVNDIVINIDNSTNFREGVIVETAPFQSVQSHTDGIVIRIYKDDELGRVVVIQNQQGLEYHYGMLADVKVNLYSRIAYGETIGVGKTKEDMQGLFYLAIIDNDTALDVVDLVNNEN